MVENNLSNIFTLEIKKSINLQTVHNKKLGIEQLDQSYSSKNISFEFRCLQSVKVDHYSIKDINFQDLGF